MRIENRLLELLAEKRRKDKRRWSYKDIYQATGITPATLSRLAQQQHVQYDNHTIAALCEFLGCSVGDFLVLVGDDEPGQPSGV